MRSKKNFTSQAPDVTSPPPSSPILQGELLPAAEKVVGSNFDIVSILLCVRLVIGAAISMRAAWRVYAQLSLIQSVPPLGESSHTTVQNLMLRIGVYFIEHHAGFNPNRLWIIDHTQAAGTTKCLIVVGGDAAVYLLCNRLLEHRDLETLADPSGE